MALLIDGYNLLNVTAIVGDAGAGTALHRTRMALLDFLATSIDERERRETMIVFDAAGAPPGLPRTTEHEGMTVHFARRHSDADEMIEELLEQHAAPRSLVVVSSDHQVQRAARRVGASFVDSELWYRDILIARRERGLAADERPAKPSGEVTPDEVAYWTDEFADAPPDEPANPFPPGYAEDVSEED
jgi:predicted RNA-binding protein with PIN domain